MSERSLSWRVEETTLNAFPSLRQIIYRDWLLRFSDGFTRRANSINPRAARIDTLEADIETCAALFARGGGQPVFRVPEICDARLDGLLERLDYAAEGRTLTLFGEMEGVASAVDPAAEILARPSREWLDAMGALQQRSPVQNAAFERIMNAIAVPTAFAALRQEGEITALTLGAVHDGLLCFESVVTGERHRGKGHARRLLGSLNAWALGLGAQGVCLQVEATNVAGRALYDRLGLKTALYAYHYRRAPA
ncbi:MAG: GNAT family N-acetyltransferase [Reyranellaceae bacterium]